MSKITNLLKQVYKPFCAVVAYEADMQGHNPMFYLERYNICKDGSLGFGKPLSQSALSKLLTAVSQTNKSLDTNLYGIVPNNVLYCDTRMGNETLVWYRKPEEQFLFFVESLGIPNGKMVVPGLVYAVKNKRLRMFAFKGCKPKQQLFFAPFMNTSVDFVCLGNSKLKYPEEKTFSNVMTYWETMFWQSEFSHILGENPCLGNLSVITKDCINKSEAFPADMLKPVSVKLSELLK